eukprot:1132425-Rhodomonas_salina.1
MQTPKVILREVKRTNLVPWTPCPAIVLTWEEAGPFIAGSACCAMTSADTANAARSEHPPRA